MPQNGQFHSLRARLLRIPIFYKILIANSAILALGAIAGTVITVWHVTSFPEDIHYELIAVFALAGFGISFIVNNLVLKRALAPLDQLQTAVDQVRQGHSDVRVMVDAAGDERFERLADTFNKMLDDQTANAHQMQQLSRQILHAQEEERHRLARELHDEAAQALTSLLVHLRLLERAHTPEDAQQRVQELRVLTAQALEDVRRVALDLRPTILDDLGLVPALEWRVDEFNKSDGVTAQFRVDGVAHRLPREMELVFYRIGQEALSNVARHAGAHVVDVALSQQNGAVCLEIKDDGCGFDPTAVRTDSDHGLGLVGMRERSAMINGHLLVESQPGRGTRICVTAPFAAASPTTESDRSA